MGDNTTLSCSPDTLARFNEIRHERAGEHTPPPTQDMMLKSLMDTWDAVDEGYYEQHSDTDELTEMHDKLDRIEAAAKEATSAAQSAEASVEELKR